MNNKGITILVIILIVFAVGGYFLYKTYFKAEEPTPEGPYIDAEITQGDSVVPTLPSTPPVLQMTTKPISFNPSYIPQKFQL